MTTLMTPLVQIATSFDLKAYAKAEKPKALPRNAHPLIDKVFAGTPIPSTDIAAVAQDKKQLWQYLDSLFTVLPWYASTAFATKWAGEATANGISLATKVIHAIAPLPEKAFFYAITVLYRPAEEGGIDFEAAGSAAQTAEEIDGDWYNAVSAFVSDLVRYRGLGVDGRAHDAGSRLYALGISALRSTQPKRKVFEDHVVIDMVHAILSGEQNLVSGKRMTQVAKAA